MIDSRNLSTGIDVLVVKAAQAALEGCNQAEIKAIVEPLTGKIEVSFIIDTLDYLYKGGKKLPISNNNLNCIPT